MDKYLVNPAFDLISLKDIKTPFATLVELSHRKSGAKVYFLDREDDNKTFAIGFKTPPEDDTGVFHILEHCVLAGSERYPVKDPMTELMKSSLYTYINAFTYPDKTVYPVSSKNNKAFLDLISVYMDAVLHPLVLKNKCIFLSEGHRVDIGEDGTPVINGVVYNEMTGAYSSPEELTDRFVSKLVYNGGSYSYDSGGWPSAIPSLSYESFLSAHRRFYHPSNSVIFLDGSVELENVLSLIDSYLSEYDKDYSKINITVGKPDTAPLTEYYPQESEARENKTRLTLAYPGFSHSDYLDTLALSCIIDSIADSNSSPLKKPIVDSGLCENFHVYYSASNKRGTLFVQFINVKDGCEREITDLFDKTVRKIISEGISSTSIESVINITEFKTREADFGSFPRGMIYMNAVIEYAVFGEDPANAFEYDGLFTALREKLNTGYYEAVLDKVLSNPRCTLILKPKEDHFIAHGIGEFDKGTVEEEALRLFEWTSTPDSEEALSRIPKLSLSDVGERRPRPDTKIYECGESTVLERHLDTSGIVYLDLFFDASDVKEEDLPTLRLITLLIGDSATKKGDAKHFKDRVKMHLGDLSVTITPVTNGKNARVYLTVRASALLSKADILGELIEELIYTADLTNRDALSKKLEQLYTASEEALCSDALSACISRVSARYDPLSAVREYMYGYEFHRFLKKSLLDVDTALSEVRRVSLEMREKILMKKRLIASVTTDSKVEPVLKILDKITDGGTKPRAIEVKLLEKRNEAIVIPGGIGYTAYGSNIITELSEKYRGALGVLTSILGYEHLWGEIRVKGGAYDTGMLVRGGSGGVVSYSYRDPSPYRSIEIFSSVSGLAPEIIENTDFDKYIISTLGAMDTVTTPRSEGSSENLLYLSEKPLNHSEIIRNEVISTDKRELLRFASILSALKESSTYCIAAPKFALAPDENLLEI